MGKLNVSLILVGKSRFQSGSMMGLFVNAIPTMTTYKIELDGDVLKIGFGEPAQNDQIVRDAADRLDEMTEAGELNGGALLKINGPASLPVAGVLIHKVGHLYGAIGVYDPKLGKYVIAITHNPAYKLGDLID